MPVYATTIRRLFIALLILMGLSFSAWPVMGAGPAGGYEAGDVIALDGLTLTILGWDLPPADEALAEKLPDGHKIVAVEFAAENHGADPLTPGYKAILVDGGGQRYLGIDNQPLDFLYNKQHRTGMTVEPCEVLRGYMVFDLPADVPDKYSLIFNHQGEEIPIRLGAEPGTSEMPVALAQGGPETVPLGERVAGRDVAITVLGWRNPSPEAQSKAAAGAHLMVIEAIVENLGAQPLALGKGGDETMRLIDDLLQQYRRDNRFWLAPAQGQKPWLDIGPGDAARLTFVFEVPDRDSAYTFTYAREGLDPVYVALDAQPRLVEAPAETSPSGEAQYAVGDVIRAGDLALEVFGWRFANSIDDTGPQPGMRFVVADVLLFNQGSESTDDWLSPSLNWRFRLQDAGLRLYPADYRLTSTGEMPRLYGARCACRGGTGARRDRVRGSRIRR